VNPFAVLAVAAIAQAIFLAALIGFLMLRRRRTRIVGTRVEELRLAARGTLREWLAGGGSVAPFVASLRSLPPDTALELAAEISTSVLGSDARSEFARAVRDEPWMRKIRLQYDSREWWRRREAARALAIVGIPEDRPLVERLLRDKQPAVAIITVGAVPRVANAELIGFCLDRLPYVSGVVRRFLTSALAQLRSMVEPELTARIREGVEPRALAHWIGLAAELRLTGALDRAASLDSHRDTVVRSAVARALGRRPHPDSLAALRALSQDGEPEVRAAAARAMGQLGSVAAIAALSKCAHDSKWEVRHEATLALATLGERGRAVIAQLREGHDKYVSDTARVISGLSDGALLELVAE
jgi:HEAT repeat protein